MKGELWVPWDLKTLRVPVDRDPLYFDFLGPHPGFPPDGPPDPGPDFFYFSALPHFPPHPHATFWSRGDLQHRVPKWIHFGLRRLPTKTLLIQVIAIFHPHI